MLAALGLGAEAEDVYTALVSGGARSAAALAADLALDPATVSSAIAALTEHGLLTPSADDARVLQPAPPDLALGAILAKRRHEIGQAEVAIARLADEFRQSGQGNPDRRLIEVVRGAPVVAQRFQQVQEAAVAEVRTFVTAPVVAVTNVENTAEDEAVARGVRFRVVVDGKILDEPAGRDGLDQVLEPSTQVRVAERVPGKLLIADDSVAMVPLSAATDGEPGAVVVHGGALVDLLGELFESIWRVALPLPGRTDETATGSAPGAAAGAAVGSATGSAAGLDDLELVDRRMLSLLLAGHTDAAVGRQLDLSERTVQRRLGALMRRSGVSTRLQLGWTARQRGWLGEQPS